MKKIYLILTLLISVNIVVAQSTNKSGTTAAQFLKIGVGARATAMSGSVVGLIDDASSVYWNPSGLVGVNRMSIDANITDWFLDVEHKNFTLVFPIDASQSVAVSATLLSMGKMEITTEREPTGTGYFFEASDFTVGLSYAIQVVDFFSFGVNAKYITQNIYKESASAFAIDLGTTLTTDYKGIKIGMSFLNFGTKMRLEGPDLQKSYDQNPNNATNTGVASNLDTEEWGLPLMIKVGVGWDIISNSDALMWSDMHKLRFGIDANHPIDTPEYLSTGVEYGWHDLIFIRSGYDFNNEERDYTLGAGINLRVSNDFSARFDYAYINYTRLTPVHNLSIGISL